jgi:hypothetical protein
MRHHDSSRRPLHHNLLTSRLLDHGRVQSETIEEHVDTSQFELSLLRRCRCVSCTVNSMNDLLVSTVSVIRVLRTYSIPEGTDQSGLFVIRSVYRKSGIISFPDSTHQA